MVKGMRSSSADVGSRESGTGAGGTHGAICFLRHFLSLKGLQQVVLLGCLITWTAQPASPDNFLARQLPAASLGSEDGPSGCP